MQLSATLLLVSKVDMRKMRCFSIGGMKILHDAILQSFGTTGEILINFTHSFAINNLFSSLLLPFLCSPKKYRILLFYCSSQPVKLFPVKFWLSRKIIIIEIVLSEILT